MERFRDRPDFQDFHEFFSDLNAVFLEKCNYRIPFQVSTPPGISGHWFQSEGKLCAGQIFLPTFSCLVPDVGGDMTGLSLQYMKFPYTEYLDFLCVTVAINWTQVIVTFPDVVKITESIRRQPEDIFFFSLPPLQQELH